MALQIYAKVLPKQCLSDTDLRDQQLDIEKRCPQCTCDSRDQDDDHPRNRIIVVAELIGEPAEYFARPDAAPQTGFAFIFDQEALDEVLPNDGTQTVTEDIPPELKPTEEGNIASNTQNEKIDEADPLPTPTQEVSQSTRAPESVPLPTERATSFGEGLDGDRSAILPSITWGLALLALMISSNFIANRWRKLPTYLIAFTPFVIVLSVWFFNLDRALPSY